MGSVFAIRLSDASATVLTYLALVAVPPLAAVALGWAARGHRPRLVAVAMPLFLFAWFDRAGLVGKGAALALSALSCVTLAALLVEVAPIGWLKLGIVLMALADAVLVSADQLQGSERRAQQHRAGGKPAAQRAEFGSAVMGYGDLFIAAALGAVLATEQRRQRPAALLTLTFALVFDLLFFVVRLLPATVPVAGALIAIELAKRRQGIRGRLIRRDTTDWVASDCETIDRGDVPPASGSAGGLSRPR